MKHGGGGVIALVFFGLYVLMIVLLIRRVRSRVPRATQGAAAALAAQGAKIESVSTTSGFVQVGDVAFTLDGRRGRVHVGRYGRNYRFTSVSITSPPLPAILIRKEGAADRFGKSMGLNREVQIGDPAFDAAAYIESNASDDLVKRVLANPETRRGALEVVAQGYKVDMSRLGLRATLIQNAMTTFDPTPLAAVMRGLEVILPGLPPVDPSELTAPRVGRFSGPVIAALGFAFVGYLSAAAAFALVPAPVAPRGVLEAIGCGVGVWMTAVVVLSQLLRGRPRGFRELVVCSLALIVGLPATVVWMLFGLNAKLDSGSATTQSTHVLSIPKKGNSVPCEPWDASRSTQSVRVPWPLLRTLKKGDALEVDESSGALGWPWVSAVRKVP